MTTPTPPPAVDDTVAHSVAVRRAAARRTALIVAGLALSVYVGFILMNVVGQ